MIIFGEYLDLLIRSLFEGKLVGDTGISAQHTFLLSSNTNTWFTFQARSGLEIKLANGRLKILNWSSHHALTLTRDCALL